MDAMLQRHCARFIYIIPEGLRELMSDISREVLRSQPNEIYTFIADYLDALMITRENARIAIKLVESITEIAEATVDTLLSIGVTRADADEVVTIIQKHFREHAEMKKLNRIDALDEFEGDLDVVDIITERILAELNMSVEQLEKMVIIIQTAWRKFKERQEREKQMLFGMVDWRIAARSAIALYRKTGVTHYEANRAASLIKAAYKGYYTRRVMKRLLQKGIADDSILYDDISWELEEQKQQEESTASSRLSILELEEQSAESLLTEAVCDTQIISPYTDADQTQLGEDILPMDVEQYVYNADEDHASDHDHEEEPDHEDIKQEETQHKEAQEQVIEEEEVQHTIHVELEAGEEPAQVEHIADEVPGEEE